MLRTRSGDVQAGSKPDQNVVYPGESVEVSRAMERSAPAVSQSTGSNLLNSVFGTLIGFLAHLAKGVGILGAAVSATTWKTRTSSQGRKIGELQMPRKTARVTSAERDRWMERRDAHRARIERDPARAVPLDAHVDVAILEDWLDGELSDEYVETYMLKYPDCEQCRAAHTRYKHLKASTLLHQC
jgi:hypothetical protein